MRRMKYIIIIVLCMLTLVGVGYSYLSTTLHISGTAKLIKPKFDVKFSNLVVNTNSISAVNPAVINENKRVDYSLVFTNPGTFYEFSVDCINNDTKDVMIKSVNLSPLDESIASYFNYSVSYYDEIFVNQNDLLEKEGDIDKFVVKIELKPDVVMSNVSIPQLDLSFSIDYVEADSNAVDVFHYYELKDFIVKAKSGLVTSSDLGTTFLINLGDYGVHNVRVVNTSTPSVCSNSGFSQSCCGVVLEFTDIIDNSYFYSTMSNTGGYPNSILYNKVNDIFSSFPDILKKYIITTRVLSNYGSGDNKGTGPGGRYVTNDKLYLLDAYELESSISNSSGHTLQSYERVLDYYVNNPSADFKKKKSNNYSDSDWWLRSPVSTNNVSAWFVMHGSVTLGIASLNIGVSPAFRLA